MGLEQHVDDLRHSIRGRLIAPGDADYDESRQLWNAMIDKRPALIVQCAETSDVVRAVNFAREHELVLAVRGGGHNVAGNATCDDGLVIDLRLMNAVTVDPDARVARAQGGATWRDFDKQTQAHGLATPGGVVSSTGIGGLTLGGGIGWLSRSYGLSCDNVVEAEVVTADGGVVTASEKENPDLFWGLRGGGGNFGVATHLSYRLHPVTELLAGIIIHPRSEAPMFLRAFRDFMDGAPDSVSSFGALLSAPDGAPVVAAYVTYHGEAAEGERVLAPLRRFGAPVVDDIAVKSYADVQTAFDAGFPEGKRHYWKSSAAFSLDDALIDTIIDHAARAPSPLTAIALEEQFGGAVARVPKDATAFGLRDVQHNLTGASAAATPPAS
jgi:FAD/FMN-containing dehydrogenase